MNDSSPGSGKSADDSVRDLLDQLSSNRADYAWTEFLQRFSPLILQVARQFDHRSEHEGDCFLFVCEKLCDDGFRRLRSYRFGGAARFQTWLKAVVANLCIDWQRSQLGRFRPTAAIAGLPELDQHIYRCIYARGMTRDQCLHALEPRFPGITSGQVVEVNARLFSLLSSQQRWQLSSRARGSFSLDETSPKQEDSAIQPEDPGPGPEVLAQGEQERERLEAAIAQLDARQRLLLRLRYLQDLTLEEVARLLGIPDPYRANREIQGALAALAELMKPRES